MTPAASEGAEQAIPLPPDGRGGAIILVASQMTRVANAGQAAYGATKGGLGSRVWAISPASRRSRPR